MEDEAKNSDLTGNEVGFKKPPKDSQFKEGESGNPNGRPKGSRNLSTILREMLNEDIEVTENGEKSKKKLQDIIVRKLIVKAQKGEGDLKAIKEIFDRLEGRPAQSIDANVTFAKPTIINWSESDTPDTETEGSEKTS